jgi:thioredoxin 1
MTFGSLDLHTNMKIISLSRVFLFCFALSQFSAPAMAAQSAAAKKVSEKSTSFAFEPLDNWKAAVLAGDRTALAGFYTTNPASRSKTPQGETLDPNEEPNFWSSLKPSGLDRLNVQVLEAQTLQPGVMSLVLRMEAGIKQGGQEKSVIIGASQVWVQKLGDWKIIATQRSDPSDKQVRRLPEPAKPNTQLYPPPEEAQPEISEALAAAQKDHKRVILVFGGNWCYDCHVLDATFRSKEFAPLVNANYHVIHINVGNYDANLDLAEKYQIPLKKGVPSLAILDPDGTLVVSQKQGEFESTVKIGPEDVIEFLKKWKPQRGS